jgi:hypothetical protein
MYLFFLSAEKGLTKKKQVGAVAQDYNPSYVRRLR